MQIDVITVLITILVFGVLIFVHELGHFLACKFSGVRVNEFAMGMGPTVFKTVKGETTYALRLFPIGGFVAMEGEDEASEDERAFNKVNVWKRLLILVAGSCMNLLLGFIILVVLTGKSALLGTTQVNWFYEDAVTNQWLQPGDIITKVNGHRVRTNNDLVYEFVRDRDGVMDMQVIRRGEEVELDRVAFQMEEFQEGVQTIIMDFAVVGVPKTFEGTVSYSLNWTVSLIKQVWGSLIDLITGRFGLNQLSGPVGVTSVIGEATSMGLRQLFVLVAFITVNLGVFNLLPLPALDGGRLLFVFWEMVRGRPVNPKYEGIIHTVGFALLMMLMVVVTFKDIMQLFQ